MIATDLQSLECLGGFSVDDPAILNGTGLSSSFSKSSYDVLLEGASSDAGFNAPNDTNTCDIGLPKDINEGKMDKVKMNVTKEHGVGLQGLMGVASSPKPNGESFLIPSSSCSLTLIENDTLTHFPSTEEVIVFGGIPKPSAGLRSSTRLGGQPNADIPLMEKAMKNAQLQADSLNTSKSTTSKYSIINIPDVDIAKRADRLGVSLGSSQDEINRSIRGIKLVEEERILTILKKNENDRE
jgi:hypothetical protein